MNNDRLPYSLDAEQSVLGAILNFKDAIIEVADIVEPEKFHDQRHRKIYSAMQNLKAQGDPIDLVSLIDRLKSMGQLDTIGGASYLADISTQITSTANVRHHAKIVHNKHLQRKMIELCDSVSRECYDTADPEGVVNNLSMELLKMPELSSSSGATLMSDGLEDVVDMIGQQGIMTGYEAIDYWTHGLMLQEHTVLGGRPGQGKTALAMGIADNLAKRGVPVGIQSIEMSKNMLNFRYLCAGAKVDLLKAKAKIREPVIGKAFTEEFAKRYNLPLVLFDFSTETATIDSIRRQAYYMKQKWDIQLLIIDHFHLILHQTPDNKGMTVTSNFIQRLAKQLNIHILLLAQLNKAVEDRNPPIPTLRDLRECGALEQDARNVIFVWRPEYYDYSDAHGLREYKGVDTYNLAEIKIAKQSNGPTGSRLVTFLKEYARFENYISETGGLI